MKQGDIINKLLDLRGKKRALETQIKEIVEEYDELKQTLIDQFQNEGTFSGKTEHGSATLTETTIASANDMPAFWQFVLNTRDISLVSYARPNSKACQELVNTTGADIPGVTFIVQRDISLRSR